jgi:hypothetical protein
MPVVPAVAAAASDSLPIVYPCTAAAAAAAAPPTLLPPRQHQQLPVKRLSAGVTEDDDTEFGVNVSRKAARVASHGTTYPHTLTIYPTRIFQLQTLEPKLRYQDTTPIYPEIDILQPMQ